jgi:hypothetical protein
MGKKQKSSFFRDSEKTKTGGYDVRGQRVELI